MAGCAILAPGVAAQGSEDAASPATVVAEPATPTALAIRWPVVGDRNRNATIGVAYRKSGAETWTQAYPLFRTHNDRVSPDNAVRGGHLFAGSIVDLTPDTAYDVRLALEDPDGGSTVRSLRLQTASIPREPDGMQTRNVVPLAPGQPAGGSGTRSDPFRGLKVALARARPGDLLLLGPGTYAESGLSPAVSGTRERPIIVRGPADLSAVLDGRGADVLADLGGRAHVWLDRLTLRGARTLVKADRANFVSATRSRFEIQHLGFDGRGAIYRESTGFYVADNVFAGTVRWPRSKGIEKVYGVTVTGAGHVVAYNLIHNVGDAVHNGDVGRLSASDIHNNDIDVCTDDGIEADYSDTNVRVFRNRITNCFSGISLQPAHGGPVYIFRNLLFNLEYTPFKLHNETAGAVIFHNTSVKFGTPFAILNQGETVRDVVTRNNLFVGTGTPALRSTGAMSRCDFDNDGYEYGQGPFATWNDKTYRSAMMARGGGLYARYGAFTMGPHRTFAGAFAPPANHRQRLDRNAHDPRLGTHSRAIDRGVKLPNFNMRFAGKAPDLGCCERGDALPWFGPRPDELRR